MRQIRFENVTYTYSVGTPFQMTALDNVSLEIEKGEFIGVIGHTGSGKSTLLQCMNGLLQPTSGKVYIDGNDIGEKKNRKDLCFKVGLVFQYPEYQLFEETVYKDIAYGPKNMGLSEGEIEDRVKEALSFTGLGEEILDKSPFELSGGQKRRVAIAGVISMRPEILILDEPTAGLDPRGRDDILGKIVEYHQKENRTVLLSSHRMEDIAKNAQKALVMNRAGIELFGSIDEVFGHAGRLMEIGLDIPMITKVFRQLRSDGYDVDDKVYTTEKAAAELLRLVKGGDSRA